MPLEFFPLNPSGVPFKHPGAMATPYPDLRHYTVRDYGNRVGVYRILESLGDIQAGFAVNAAVAERCAPQKAVTGQVAAPMPARTSAWASGCVKTVSFL